MGNGEEGAGNRERGTGKREQGTGNREQEWLLPRLYLNAAATNFTSYFLPLTSYLATGPAISLTTSPASMSPATAGTNAVEPGVGFSPAAGAGTGAGSSLE